MSDMAPRMPHLQNKGKTAYTQLQYSRLTCRASYARREINARALCLHLLAIAPLTNNGGSRETIVRVLATRYVARDFVARLIYWAISRGVPVIVYARLVGTVRARLVVIGAPTTLARLLASIIREIPSDAI
jgi:hypothetical protein